MNTYKIIDKATWPRAEHFEFFCAFNNPSYNITVPIEAQNIYDYAKDTKTSFFLMVLYAILRAANAVPQCKQRLLGNTIIEFDRIAVMTPILTKGEIFQQIWCEYTSTLPSFIANAQPKVAQAQQGLATPLDQYGEDYLCASCNPWMHFTSLTQADLTFEQAVPILAWGKMKNGLIPVACRFNHAFMDGFHAGQFFGFIEENFAMPENLLLPCSSTHSKTSGDPLD